MWRIFKIIAQKLYQPIIAKRIGRGDNYEYDGITLFIPAGVFHPRYFFSTKYLLSELKKLNLVNKRFLELGAGNGLISLSIAKCGATVIASDINVQAIKALDENAKINHLQIQTFVSDMFNDIPDMDFDIIAINPPYFPQNARNNFEKAWYCGSNYEYFHQLFTQLKQRISENTLVLMVLSEHCNLKQIIEIAKKQGLNFSLYTKKRVWWELQLIYRITSRAD